MLNTSTAWPANDYPVISPGVDNWLNQNDEWGLFGDQPLTSPTTETGMFIQPNALNMYNSSTSTSSRNHNTIDFSETSSPEAPSLCDDDLTLRSPKQESTYAPSPTNAMPAPPRKRGRPRTVRTGDDGPCDNHAKPSKPSKRQPHNQVERKYREGLNAELERLRLALPTLHKWEMAASCGSSGMPKASKAAVLAGAVAYIQDMERERDHLRRENELLRLGRGIRRQYE
jgi:hypothetical protein